MLTRLVSALRAPSPRAFIDATALVDPTTPVWHFARVLAHVTVGAHGSIGGGSEIGTGSRIGIRTRIGAGTFLPPHSVIGNEVFIGPNVTFTDDVAPMVPQVGDAPYTARPPVVEDRASIGAGAIILPGVSIGVGARVAAGAIVTRDVPAHGFVRGKPARNERKGATAAKWTSRG